MCSYYLRSNSHPQADEEERGKKRPITNSGDSFVVDVPQLSQLSEKAADTANTNSRLITRTLSTKGSIERKTYLKSPSIWPINPRRIFLLFATLSSMGTIILIYFTLTIGNHTD